MAEEIRYDADEANQVSARLIADSIAADNPVNAVFGGLRVSGGVNLEFTRGINSFLKGSIDVIRSDRQKYKDRINDYSERLSKATVYTAAVEEDITAQLQSKRNEIDSFDVHEI